MYIDYLFIILSIILTLDIVNQNWTKQQLLFYESLASFILVSKSLNFQEIPLCPNAKLYKGLNEKRIKILHFGPY